MSGVDLDGGKDDWIVSYDEKGNITYTAEEGDNLASFMSQFNISLEAATNLFSAKGFLKREGGSDFLVKAGDSFVHDLLALNINMTKTGWFSSDYYSSETQQKAIDYLLFGVISARARGEEEIWTNKILNFDDLNLSGSGGISDFKGRIYSGGKRISIRLSFATKFSITRTSIYYNQKRVNMEPRTNFVFFRKVVNRNSKTRALKSFQFQVPAKYEDTFGEILKYGY